MRRESNPVPLLLSIWLRSQGSKEADYFLLKNFILYPLNEQYVNSKFRIVAMFRVIQNVYVSDVPYCGHFVTLTFCLTLPFYKLHIFRTHVVAFNFGSLYVLSRVSPTSEVRDFNFEIVHTVHVSIVHLYFPINGRQFKINRYSTSATPRCFSCNPLKMVQVAPKHVVIL